MSVCGFSCPVLQANASQINCSLPQMQTPTIQATYQKSNISQLINSSLYTLFSSNPATQSNINDGKYTTYFTSTSAQCYVGFNYGNNLQVQVDKIYYVPRVNLATLMPYYGAVFQGSQDNVTWTTIYTIGNEIKLGLNILQVNLSTAQSFQVRPPWFLREIAE